MGAHILLKLTSPILLLVACTVYALGYLVNNLDEMSVGVILTFLSLYCSLMFNEH